MSTKRKKVATALFALFLLSRSLDAYATWYYSPNLALEANPIVLNLGSDWIVVWILQALAFLFACWWCFVRLAKKDYKKVGYNEKILHSIFNKKYSTAVKRYADDFTGLFTLIIVGFLVALLWVLIHGFSYDIFDGILGFYIGSIPATIPVLLLIGFIIAKPLGNYVAKYYVEHEL